MLTPPHAPARVHSHPHNSIAAPTLIIAKNVPFFKCFFESLCLTYAVWVPFIPHRFCLSRRENPPGGALPHLLVCTPPAGGTVEKTKRQSTGAVSWDGCIYAGLSRNVPDSVPGQRGGGQPPD